MTISVAGEKLDPETAIASQFKMALPPIQSPDGTQYTAELR